MDKLRQLEHDVPNITTEHVMNCNYCTMISPNLNHKTPIFCTKFSGSDQPISVNINTCISCGEYKKTL